MASKNALLAKINIVGLQNLEFLDTKLSHYHHVDGYESYDIEYFKFQQCIAGGKRFGDWPFNIHSINDYLLFHNISCRVIYENFCHCHCFSSVG